MLDETARGWVARPGNSIEGRDRVNNEKLVKPASEQPDTSLEQGSISPFGFEEEKPAREGTHQLLAIQQELLREQASDPRILVQRRHAGQRLRTWFISSTFTPPWLPERLQHPVFGYLVALLLQIIAVLVTLYLDDTLQTFIFIGSLEVLAIALVALSWGVGPSVVATFFGACLFYYVILPPHFSWTARAPGDIYQLLLVILIGLAISIVASQTERARRRAQRLADSLTKEHARLEAIIETVPDIVTIYDKRGRMVQMNGIGRQSRIFDPGMKIRTLEELFKAHEALTLAGKPIDTDDLPIAHALRGETVESQEIRFVNSEGNECFISISAAPLRNIHGKVDGVVSITRDLSALHQSEREAANRALELETILQSLADGFFVVDTTGAIVRSNTAFQEIIGCTEQNREWFFALPDDERHALLEARDEQGQPLAPEEWPEARILKGEVLKDSHAVDLHIRSLDGRELQVNVSGAPLYNREGELIAALCICHDVTERRKLEQRTHDALDALLTMAEALVTSGEEGTMEEQNRIAASKKIALRMARLTSSVLGSQRVSIFLVEPETGFLRPLAIVGLSPDEEQRWWTEMEQLGLNIHDPTVSQTVAQLQKGEIVLLDMQAEPFTAWVPSVSEDQTSLVAPMSVGKQLIGFLALGQDTPDSIYTQENIALAGAVAKLLALVFERERLLDERASAQATELALRAANRRMEEFLGMVSHELKTPLTSIKGNTQLALRQLKSSMQTFERIIALHEAADQQTRRLNRLVDDLLDVSRAQAGHLEIIAGPCDLRDIVREALQEQRKMWPGRTINLDMDEQTALPLYADADRIGQVISNYLTNALKYSDADRPVFVKVLREGQQAFLAVRDQGPGLPADEQERIWSRFHRTPGIEVRSSSHTSQAGLGLGLYISKTIIESLQGEVGVQSLPGKGSTFWFRLPLASKETGSDA
jgi:PAS domain S-box-containing protein